MTLGKFHRLIGHCFGMKHETRKMHKYYWLKAIQNAHCKDPDTMHGGDSIAMTTNDWEVGKIRENIWLSFS